MTSNDTAAKTKVTPAKLKHVAERKETLNASKEVAERVRAAAAERGMYVVQLTDVLLEYALDHLLANPPLFISDPS